MNEKRYVQHMSGIGQKWGIVRETNILWVTSVAGPTDYHLPKSEYLRCDPPEEWVDVTAHLVVSEDHTEASEESESIGAVQTLGRTYRLRKIQLYDHRLQHHNEQWAFLIEKRRTW